MKAGNLNLMSADEIFNMIFEKLKDYCKENDIDIKSEKEFRELVLSEIKFLKLIYNVKEDFYEYIKNRVVKELKRGTSFTDDIFAEYLRDIENLDIITKDEEKDLYTEAKNNTELKNKIVEANLKLVIYVAKRYLNHGLSLEDLVQEGNLGLIKAVERYDPNLGYQFSTYAFWWIKQCVVRAIEDKGKIIRLPAYMSDKIRFLKKETYAFEKEFKRTPTDDELAIIMGISKEEVDFIKKSEQEPISLNIFLGEDEDSELESFISNDTQSIEDGIVKADLTDKVQELFEKGPLNEREVEILKMRFGFYDNNVMTLEEIGQKYGLTRERVRQIEAKAILKLKKSTMISDFIIYAEKIDDKDVILARTLKRCNYITNK